MSGINGVRALYSSEEESSYLPALSLRGGAPQTDRIYDPLRHQCSRSDTYRRPQEPRVSEPGPSPESVRREEEEEEEQMT